MKLKVAKNRLIVVLLGAVLVAAALTLLLLRACQPAEQQRPVIAVSIPPQRYLLEQLTGGNFDVVCLLQDEANPESYEPSMNNVLALEQSRAYFMMGHIGFEAAILSKVSASRPDLKVIDTSTGIDLVASGHGPNVPDPHVWVSVGNARHIAANMHHALVDLDPPHRGDYDRRYAHLRQRLDSLDGALRSMLDSARGRAFVVWHPSLTYFARDYGLRQLAVEQDGLRGTPQRVEQVLDEARRLRVATVLTYRDIDGRTAAMARALDARVAEINPMSHEWDRQLLRIAHALTDSVP